MKPTVIECRQNRCVLLEGSYRAPDPGGCVLRALHRVVDGTGIEAKVVMEFHVGKDGIPYAFSFNTPTRSDLALPLVQAVRSCTFDPGRNAKGEPLTMRYIQPLRFEP